MPFFGIFPIFLTSFGCAMICLGMNRDQEDDAQIVPEFFGWWFIDTMISQYMLALGEFADPGDRFEGKQHGLCYTFFILSTFLTCVTALNMIIAIMSATFDQVSD